MHAAGEGRTDRPSRDCGSAGSGSSGLHDPESARARAGRMSRRSARAARARTPGALLRGRRPRHRALPVARPEPIQAKSVPRRALDPVCVQPRSTLLSTLPLEGAGRIAGAGRCVSPSHSDVSGCPCSCSWARLDGWLGHPGHPGLTRRLRHPGHPKTRIFGSPEDSDIRSPEIRISESPEDSDIRVSCCHFADS